ncbi:aldose 1-epimerase [Jimgerdemannia flammicorona]|uniref:Aldose 1-epimerase n=1 Tax=Jimgerdemannia flammicorona TaxID=994334 RepID=A0A433CZB9_9FUNG|nr:aldose 1-epimerase [Jimgerdemannia flammicorona]
MPVTKSILHPAHGVDRYTLSNSAGTLTVNILNYGGIVQHILVLDRDGVVRDVTLGFDTYQEYTEKTSAYFGGLIGRFANRIAFGKFTLDGTTYNLATNNGPNHLHGGLSGFDKKIWTVTVLSQDPPSIRLTHISPDGDEGYPGTLTTHVTYTVTTAAELSIEYVATTSDKATIVNLTNHAYFNLAGVTKNPRILDHQVEITPAVLGYLELDDGLCPTGTLIPTGTIETMDFSGAHVGRTFGARIAEVQGKGYDHPYVIRQDAETDTRGQPLVEAVRVRSPETGITLKFATTEPAFQLYTGNFIPEEYTAKKETQDGVAIGPWAGFCLESSRNPDAPNKEAWVGQVVLRVGKTYGSKSVFGFGVRD